MTIDLVLTQFKCGSLALASRANHCTLDGIAAQDLWANLASLTLGEGMIMRPDPDRTLFKARVPPMIIHTHFEYSKLLDSDALFSTCGTCSHTLKQPSPHPPHLVYISSDRIAGLKTDALRDGRRVNCTTFHVIAARIWKARSVVMGLPDDRMSTMLFPVDVRRRMVPQPPQELAENAVVPGYARASVHEIMTDGAPFLVGKVQEGLDRLTDDYVRSGIDWLEENKGVPCRVDSFSKVAWWKLGLEEFGWGKVRSVALIDLKPGLILLLSGDKEKGGINICLELPPDQMKEFYKLMMED
ncbi:acyltransferase GLAUCE-like [Magnolia sinica]|uniref:acyltransferase GLAUCE-like n=1 Tax=Magnolia sinica TaxID=86752 RepID=UPI00265A1798|nr:acyltransferase GLAUCE-like [Magnolia sinica]